MKYIIFDIDGTLTNTTEVDDKCYVESFESMFRVSIKGVQWNQIKNVTDWGITEELVRTKLDRKITAEEILALKRLFQQKLIEEFESDSVQFGEIQGATKFYNSLLTKNEFKIGIATGGWEETANYKLAAVGINPHSVSYSNSNHHISREEITLDVIKQLEAKSNTKPEEIIYFGDGQWDYKTCKKLNIRFIGIDSANNGKLKNEGASEVYTNFENHEIMNSIV